SRPALAENKIKSCQAFVRFAQKTGKSVEKFLLEIEELAAKGAAKSPGGQQEGILITSIHRAKGLEWPLVILPGLEEGIVPFGQDREEQEAGDIEDERRLFYVGMTRAKEQLFLTYPQDSRLERRKKAGDSRSPVSTEKGAYPASCFLYEANLDFSEGLGGAILAPDAQKEAVEGADLTLGKRYLKEVQSGVRLKKKKRESGQRVKVRKKSKKK
ncbi:MAG: ATP-dependent helicase, partial [Candidatus Electrothrix sp. AUS4]|nr:ATP-dependent helicase [Candidatus Electrothrix sp. AUS4]